MRSMLRIEITFRCTGTGNNNNVKMKIMFKYQQASTYGIKEEGRKNVSEEIRAIML